MEVKRYSLQERERKKRKEEQPDTKEDAMEDKRHRVTLRKQVPPPLSAYSPPTSTLADTLLVLSLRV